MRRVLAIILAAGSLLAATVSTAQEPARLALLIGNKGYNDKVGPLKNPHNDVKIVANALRSIGFKGGDIVAVTDRKRSEILVAVRQFANRLAAAGPAAIGFLYYSGHGAAEGGTTVNYLIPVDAGDPNDPAFWDEALKLDELTTLLRDRAPHAAHFVVFDACRNELKLPDKTSSKGFAVVPTLRGMHVAFASEFGRTASDVGATSGPYAAALAAELVKPGLSHLDMFQNVKEAVSSATGGKQVPWELNGLSQRVHLAGLAPSLLSGAADVVRVCREVETMTSLSMLAVLERQHAGTPSADCISARMGELKATQAAAKAAEAQAKADAERQRLAMLQQQDAETKRVEAETARKRAEAANPTQPGQVFRDCADCPEMVVVPAGSFMMGSPASEKGREADEGPQRRVTITKPLAVGRFEVTWAEWESCVAAKACDNGPVATAGGDQGWGKGKRPVINVSWNDAKAYAGWLSKKTGQPYRLLTEAEWEYAARAGTTTPFSFGATINPDQANYDGNYTYGSDTKGNYRGKTVEVGSLNQPNGFGLHDMHGNVWEWVEDCYANSYANAPTNATKAPDTKDCSRVLRGGSWSNGPQLLRSAIRGWLLPDYLGRYFGFRLARTLNPTP
ncbi:MAG: hypothetical protein CTY20_00745 [Hyphomicrobium sp.]|nr:MAG: hypothetical protein CTY20_00745 [Hyphomicrobium sp.]